MLKALTKPHHFTKMESLFPPIVLINVLELSQESEWSYIYVLGVSIVLLSNEFSIGFWHCSDSVIAMI